MEEIERALMGLRLDAVERNTTYMVEATYIITPFTFFVRPLSHRPLIDAWESTAPSIQRALYYVNDKVIFNYGYSCGERKYIRGRVLRVAHIQNFIVLDVFAIDYGFIEKNIPIQYVWDCPEALKNTPALAFDCQLANCYPLDSVRGFTEDTIDTLKYYAGRENLQMKVLDIKPTKILVELVVLSIPESIATLLATSGLTLIGCHLEQVPWRPIVGRNHNYFKHRKLTVGQTLHVRVQSGFDLSDFHVAEISDFHRFLPEVEFISFYANKEFPLSPAHFVEGTNVCIKMEDKNIYERGFIKKVTNIHESAIVQLVDWGLDELFHIDKMKYMALQCLRAPVLAIHCKCEGNQAWENGLERFLTPGYEFNMTVRRLGFEFEAPNEVDIYPLINSVQQQDEARALPINLYK